MCNLLKNNVHMASIQAAYYRKLARDDLDRWQKEYPQAAGIWNNM